MIFQFFTDPILRGPTLGSIFMCVASALMGTLIFFQKKTLLSESLSHAAYPGACLGAFLFSLLFPDLNEWAFLGVLLGAFISSLLGLKAIEHLKRGRVTADAALTLILALFFGFGVVVVSAMQTVRPKVAKQVQMLLFGQAATMSDMHIWIYGLLGIAIILFLFCMYRPLQAFLFDPHFARCAKVPVRALEKIVFWLLILSIVVSIRSVGVILMSGMLIAPAVAGRSFANRLDHVLQLSALFGALSAFLGSILSVHFDLPTGPSIVLVGSFFALFGLLFSPSRGLLFRLYRMGAFRMKCAQENLLKKMWKRGGKDFSLTLIEKMALFPLRRAGWVDRDGGLTQDGRVKAALIVRLHRLWELYLTEELGFSAERVHRTAEEMEHILTKEMEERLTQLLEDPKRDPHDQPIPAKEY